MLIDIFSGNQTLTEKEAQELVQITRRFDQHNILTPTKRKLLLDTVIMFAGEDKKLQRDEFEGMTKVIGSFSGADKSLSEEEAKTMFDIVKKFDFDGNGWLDGEELKELEALLKLFAGKKSKQDEELNAHEIKDMEEVIDLFDGKENRLTKPRFDRMLNITNIFKKEALRMTERSVLLSTLRYFAGPNRDMGECEANDLLELVGLMKGEDGILDAEEANTMLTEIIKLFDTDNNGVLDEEERKLLLKMVQYFAGDDKNMEETDLIDMKKVIDLFDEKHEFDIMVEAVNVFDHNGDGKLKKEERDNLLLTLQYFAGEVKQIDNNVKEHDPEENADLEDHELQEHDPEENSELEDHELQEMNLVVGYFDGVDNKLSTEEALIMLEVLNMFDGDRNQKFDDVERDDVVKTTRFFAGVDGKIDKDEIADMKKVIGFFSGEDKILQKEEATSMLTTIELFDSDGNGSLDDQERTILVQSCRYFAGDDQSLDPRELSDMTEVFSYCDGEDGWLNMEKAQAAVDIIDLFDSDKSGGLSDEERGHVTKTFKFFAGEDKKLDASELKDMAAITKLFGHKDKDLASAVVHHIVKGNIKHPVAQNHQNRLSVTEAREMMEILEYFDLDLNEAFDDKERDALLTMAKSFAGEDEKLSQEEINEMRKVIKFFLHGDNVRSKAKAHDLLRDMLTHVSVGQYNES